MALNLAVVSDSTTIISLINIDRFELLFKFTKKIIITQSVYNEIAVLKLAKQVLDNYILLNKLEVIKIRNRAKLKELLIRLDLGESESIILAKERNLPLIIDEKRGKKVAISYNINCIGLVGILLVYKQKKWLLDSEIKQIINELQSVGFRVSDKLIELLSS